MVTLEQLAAVVRRPADQLVELDRRPVRFAFLDRSCETVVVRDRATGETLEVTLDAATAQQADPEQLLRSDRELAGTVGGSLSPTLRRLVVAHPELSAVRVAVASEGQREPRPLLASVRELVALAQEPGVARIELLEDPEIQD